MAYHLSNIGKNIGRMMFCCIGNPKYNSESLIASDGLKVLIPF